jgi:hypothetical protein
MSASHTIESRHRPPSNRDDSIEEMASLLLNDTTIDQLKAEPGKRLLQIGSSQALTDISSFICDGSKALPQLPQLPQLIFNGDDAWAMKMAPVVTAAGSSNEVHFNGNNGELKPPKPPQHQPAQRARKGSGPPIPRKSSKRKSARPKSTLTKSRPAIGDQQTSTNNYEQPLEGSMVAPSKPQVAPQPKTSTPVDAVEVNKKIEAMMAATRTLKGDAPYHGPFVPSKKRRIKDNKVLVKVKTAINDRLNVRSTKKRLDSLRDDRLLDASFNDVPDYDDDHSISGNALTAMEIRMNEGMQGMLEIQTTLLISMYSGDYFKNPKIFSLTGHGNVRRKPIADDSKSLRSRKSADDPFSERPHSSGITRTPTSFENRLRDDMSIDQTIEIIPDLPELPSRIQTPKNDARARVKLFPLLLETEFDTFLSSSPLAQSTPRIRLEPTIEDGKRSLKNVPTDSRSLFDLDVDVDMPPATKVPDLAKNNSSEGREGGLGVRNSSPKNMKKHPSPTKAELEEWERDVGQFPPFRRSESFAARDDTAPIAPGVGLRAPLMVSKDANARLQRKRRGQGKGIEFFQKLELMKTTESMPDISRRSEGPKGMIEKPLDTTNTGPSPDVKDTRRQSTQNDDVDSSMMDIDELQWDSSAYNIGMRRV